MGTGIRPRGGGRMVQRSVAGTKAAPDEGRIVIRSGRKKITAKPVSTRWPASPGVWP